MEITLRKPQREVFKALKENEGSFLRIYKRGLSHKREYYRLMTADYSPIKNYTPGIIRPLINLSVLQRVEAGVFKIAEDVTLVEKEKKGPKRKK